MGLFVAGIRWMGRFETVLVRAVQLRRMRQRFGCWPMPTCFRIQCWRKDAMEAEQLDPSTEQTSTWKREQWWIMSISDMEFTWLARNVVLFLPHALSLSLSVSLSLCVYLSVSVWLSLSLYVFIRSLCVCLSLSMCLSLFLKIQYFLDLRQLWRYVA